jgi:antitoxin (DNA-binding transcriptional repressor) of toxin-antitoxin stability system
MQKTITATQLARSLSDILNRVQYRSETFVVQRNGETIATIAPAGPRLGTTLQDVAEALKDLKMPGDGFADDLEEIQANQPLAEFPDWPS